MRVGARSPETSRWRRVLHWPAFLFVNAAAFVLIGTSTLRETYHGIAVDQEMQDFQSQVQALETKKLKLKSLADTLASPEYVDIEARQALGWKKDGERVFVFSGTSTATMPAAWAQIVEPSTRESDDTSTSNFERWKRYFFDPPHSSTP